jgi:hypothetical protein
MLTSRTYTAVVILVTTNQSTLCKVKSDIFIPTQVGSGYIFFVQGTVLGSFSDIELSMKEISIYQNPFDYAMGKTPANSQLKVINLLPNEMIKGKYQGKSLIKFHKDFLGNVYTQLNLCGCEVMAVFWLCLSVKEYFQR